MNDTTQIEAYQRRLKKLDKEIQKNLEAWRDAPDPDMKDDFLKMYQDNKAEKGDKYSYTRSLLSGA